MTQLKLFVVLLVAATLTDFIPKMFLMILDRYERQWGRIKSLIWCLASLFLICMIYWILAGHIIDSFKK